MKQLLIWLVFSSLSCSAYTVKSDFLREAKIYKNAQFPLELDGYLDLSFRISLQSSSVKSIVRALIERRIDGKTESSYTGDFEVGKKTAITFPDGTPGPKLTFIEPLKKNSSVPASGDGRSLVGKAAAVRTKN